MEFVFVLSGIVLLTMLTKASQLVTPFGLNTPGPKTQLGSEHKNAVYRPSYEIIHPAVRSQLKFLPRPDKDVGPISGFRQESGQEDFLKLLKYMIPLPVNPVSAAKAEPLGGDLGLGGPMGPMSPGLMNSKYGTIIVSGPMEVKSHDLKNSIYAERIVGATE